VLLVCERASSKSISIYIYTVWGGIRIATKTGLPCMCCSVLQCVTVFCSVFFVCKRAPPKSISTYICILWHGPWSGIGITAKAGLLCMCCSALQCVEVCCGMSCRSAVRCSGLQCVAKCRKQKQGFFAKEPYHYAQQTRGFFAKEPYH